MEVKSVNPHKNKVHKVLTHSYLVYLVSFLIGVCLDFIFRIKIFSESIMVPIGFVLLAFASFVIIWAQKAGRDLRKVAEIKKEHFCRGPFCYTKIPTQWGLFFLILGFGIIANAFFVILFTVIAFLVSKLIFMEKYHQALVEKYGDAYVEYKKSVKL